MDMKSLSLDELKKGYTNKEGVYSCVLCRAQYEQGEVYEFDKRFFDAKRAVREHIKKEHPTYTKDLICWESKYNTLTDNQKRLMALFLSGMPDNDIAKHMGVSVSTVRHQRFMFREKAKQAKLYLALYENVFENGNAATAQPLMPIHEHAKMVDERYIITKKEEEHVLETSFSSMSPLKLKHFPVKEKKKVVILTHIAGQFEKGKTYTEKEVNAILKEIYDDYVTIRRYLIEYGFMERKSDCSAYWLTS